MCTSGFTLTWGKREGDSVILNGGILGKVRTECDWQRESISPSGSEPEAQLNLLCRKEIQGRGTSVGEAPPAWGIQRAGLSTAPRQ